MNKRPFMAVNWLTPSSTRDLSASHAKSDEATGEISPAQSAGAAAISTSQTITQQDGHFSIGNYVIPQWKGESLPTKEGIKLKKTIKHLFEEAIKIAKTFSSRNKTLKLTVYNEFLNFAESKNINISEISDYNQFWLNFTDEHSPYARDISKFIAHYSLRAVNIYLLKLKFLSLISRQLTKSLSTNELLNPDYSISKIFKKASSTELICESLRTNEFSWFRPSMEMSSTIEELSATLTSLGSVEFLKICNHEVPLDYDLEITDSELFSHSISNRNFGLFVNDLLIFLTEWLEGHSGYYNLGGGPKCLNTLFSGDHLYSFALSHWLAQENNIGEKWNEVICPEFNGKGFLTGSYLKVCQELQLLTFLVNMAKNQSHDPVTLICQLFKQKNSKSQVDSDGQMAFFNTNEAQESIYDRVVLNLATMPKTNPHHYLLTSIQTNCEKLANNGYLFVFSNQKLFVPSHSEKVEGLLKRYKLHASINFEDLKGKGEITKHLYIFSKRVYSNKLDLFNSSAPKMQKESCLSLNFAGQLMHFSKFELLRQEFLKFIMSKETINSPLFQNEPEPGLVFDFHQDAILNGKLLSNSSESNNITHPSYFKNLTRTCVPLDQFFIVDQISGKSENFTSDLLGLSVKREERYPYLLIVNYTNENEISLELTTSDLYKVKSEEYGHAYYQYFGLTPKILSLNINLFREYFETTVGKQVIQLTFNGGLKKTKSKLKAMLVPKFMLNTDTVPTQHHQTLDVFSYDKERLKSCHPIELNELFTTALKSINTLSLNYPWHTSCILSHFKYQLEETLNEVSANDLGSKKINYENPFMVNDLVTLPTFPIYPDHDDIYLEAKVKQRSDIHLRISHTQLDKIETGNILRIFSETNELMVIHGEYEILHFINFILSSARGTQLSSILQGLEVPKLKDIRRILEKHSEVGKGIELIYKNTQQSLNTILIGQIFN